MNDFSSAYTYIQVLDATPARTIESFGILAIFLVGAYMLYRILKRLYDLEDAVIDTRVEYERNLAIVSKHDAALTIGIIKKVADKEQINMEECMSVLVSPDDEPSLVEAYQQKTRDRIIGTQ
jgi:hypothetical protein